MKDQMIVDIVVYLFVCDSILYIYVETPRKNSFVSSFTIIRNIVSLRYLLFFSLMKVECETETGNGSTVVRKNTRVSVNIFGEMKQSNVEHKVKCILGGGFWDYEMILCSLVGGVVSIASR